MRQARQDEEQGQLAESRVAEGRGDAEGIGDLLQDIEHAKDRAEGRFRRKRGTIELSAQGAAERLDARRLPMGEIGEGAVLDFTVLAVSLAKENGGRGVAVGDGGDVLVDLIHQPISSVKKIINNYMSTNPTKSGTQLQHQSRLTQKLEGEDPSGNRQ